MKISTAARHTIWCSMIMMKRAPQTTNPSKSSEYSINAVNVPTVQAQNCLEINPNQMTSL